MKAMLVINCMPSSCDVCKFETEMLNCGKPMCVATPNRRERIDDDSTKPTWCPLKSLPKPRSETIGDETPDAEAHGWNLCIEELEK